MAYVGVLSVISLLKMSLRVRIYSTWRGDSIMKMPIVLILIGTQTRREMIGPHYCSCVRRWILKRFL